MRPEDESFLMNKLYETVRNSLEYKALCKKIEDHIMNHGVHMDDAFFAGLKSKKPEFE